ncbi:MAG TPA: alpha/beta hydrolase-fold protein [Chitinophagaceae bacterium]|nr:alpha/beta hydrolase-fold protein [Chitinophagaceae bacterium]
MAAIPEIIIFGAMQLRNETAIFSENTSLPSLFLERDVIVDFFLPTQVENPASLSLLLVNDGQNMEEVGMEKILADLYTGGQIRPLLCAAVHTGAHRKLEYGIASQADYLGRGNKAGAYTRFIVEELLPFIHTQYKVPSFADRAFAGFSLGGLSALDIVWAYPDLFSRAGVFSGSLWWRSMDQDDPGYDDDQHRIMHQVIRRGVYHQGQQFFFQTGNMDETNDRNNNGIIDSIDDTLDLIHELELKGYHKDEAIYYLELSDGRHDMPTWARALPVFLKWGWGAGQGMR